MDRRDVLRIIREHRPELRSMGAGRLSVFGSVARGDNGPLSDVDLLVELNRPMGLFDFFRLQHYLEGILGVVRVDLVMPSALKPSIRAAVLAEAIDVA